MHNHECLFPQEEFRLHFKNISKIMDCVGCFKCRLWGKLQVRFVSVWELWCWDWCGCDPGTPKSGLLIPYLCRKELIPTDFSFQLIDSAWESGITQERVQSLGSVEPSCPVQRMLPRWREVWSCCSMILFDPCTDTGLGHSAENPLLREPH